MGSAGWDDTGGVVVAAARVQACVQHRRWRSVAKAATGSLRRDAVGSVEERRRSSWDLPQTCSPPPPCF